MVPPHGDDGQRLQLGLRASSMGCSALLLALVEQWINSGSATQLVQEIQRETRARQRLARTLLSHPYQTHPTGLHVWLELPTQWNQELFTHALREQGVSVAGGQSFAAAVPAPNCLRISLGGAKDQAELGRALQTIEAKLNQDRRCESRTFAKGIAVHKEKGTTILRSSQHAHFSSRLFRARDDAGPDKAFFALAAAGLFPRFGPATYVLASGKRPAPVGAATVVGATDSN